MMGALKVLTSGGPGLPVISGLDFEGEEREGIRTPYVSWNIGV